MQSCNRRRRWSCRKFLVSACRLHWTKFTEQSCQGISSPGPNALLPARVVGGRERETKMDQSSQTDWRGEKQKVFPVRPSIKNRVIRSVFRSACLLTVVDIYRMESDDTNECWYSVKILLHARKDDESVETVEMGQTWITVHAYRCGLKILMSMLW